MARFSDGMVTEVVQRFWAAMQRGEFITDAAAEAGTYRKKGARWLVEAIEATFPAATVQTCLVHYADPLVMPIRVEKLLQIAWLAVAVSA
jgi:hypothetical protein